MPAKAAGAPTVTSLSALAREEDACKRCPLYEGATQAVPGEGPRRAKLMLIGEQPGDKEDVDGHPFVGPAGQMLDKVLEEAGLDRKTVFVTNAVKHFKYERRGKKRIHNRPNAYEIERCRWWLDLERKIVKPSVLLTLGATALRSVTGRAVSITSMRGEAHELEDGALLLATIHPSALLRARSDREARYRDFVEDIRRAAELAA